MSIPVRLVVPAHRVSSVQGEECLKWCTEFLKHGVVGHQEGKVYVLRFDDWEDASLFQREWL